MKDMKTNRQLANTVSMCAKIRMVIESDDDNDDDQNVRNKRHMNTMTGNIVTVVINLGFFPLFQPKSLNILKW